MLTPDAINRARGVGMDLVEVDPNSSPPVCRIMDFGKFKYRQKKRSHKGSVSHAGEVKELRLRPKIDDHDLMVKVKKAQKFIEKRQRVLVIVMFRGRELQHTERGLEVLKRFVELLGEEVRVEQDVRREGNRLHVTLGPK